MISQTSSENSGTSVAGIYVGSGCISAAAGGEGEAPLSSEQIAALQTAVTNIVTGFTPPSLTEKKGDFPLESMVVELKFQVKASSGSMLKLVLDASGEASILARVEWRRSK